MGLSDFVNRWHGEIVALGNIPAVIIVFLPRLCFSVLVVVVAQVCRFCAWLIDETNDVTRRPKVNKRILVVTDYLPPQTHGIAVRFQQYIEHMRRRGHEVHVFATTQRPELETSFDHPRLPSVVNPWNVKNRMAYNPGVRLAWQLGARQWDVVHVVYPSVIGFFILAVCNWRRIPVYCSHHVDLVFYARRYASKPVASVATFLYDITARIPATYGAAINAAPTLMFLRSHLTRVPPARSRRIPTGVALDRFAPDSPGQRSRERAELLARIGAEEGVTVWLMVQRLAPEKDTSHAFAALREAAEGAHNGGAHNGAGRNGSGKNGAGKAPVHLVIAGDGPSMAALQAEAKARALPVSFLGNVDHSALPPLYRAADVFVTCSTSETYGLTVVEALASGTPVAMPHCEVFDELWAKVLPEAWMYDPKQPGAVRKAVEAAGSPAGRAWLEANPVKLSWQDATDELLAQYEECIENNLPFRREQASRRVTVHHSVMALAAATALWWLMQIYARALIRVFARLMCVQVEILD